MMGVLVSLATENPTLLEHSVKTFTDQKYNTVDQFVYLVLSKFQGHANNANLLIASAMYFAEHCANSPVSYSFLQTSLRVPTIPADMKGVKAQEGLVMVEVAAPNTGLKKGQIFDVVLCKNSTPSELAAIASGSMQTDRVINMDKGGKARQLKPWKCRKYVPQSGDQSTEAREAWYEIMRAPPSSMLLNCKVPLPDGHSVANLKVVPQDVNTEYTILYFVATRQLQPGELVFWQYACTESSKCVVATDAQHFVELTRRAHENGHSVLACQCTICRNSRHLTKPPFRSKWGPSVLYVDESTSATATGSSTPPTEHTPDAQLLEHLVKSAIAHQAADQATN